MEKVKFLPVIIDYPSLLTYKIPTKEEEALYKKMNDYIMQEMKNVDIMVNGKLWKEILEK